MGLSCSSITLGLTWSPRQKPWISDRKLSMAWADWRSERSCCSSYKWTTSVLRRWDMPRFRASTRAAMIKSGVMMRRISLDTRVFCFTMALYHLTAAKKQKFLNLVAVYHRIHQCNQGKDPVKIPVFPGSNLSGI